MTLSAHNVAANTARLLAMFWVSHKWCAQWNCLTRSTPDRVGVYQQMYLDLRSVVLRTETRRGHKRLARTDWAVALLIASPPPGHNHLRQYSERPKCGYWLS